MNVLVLLPAKAGRRCRAKARRMRGFLVQHLTPSLSRHREAPHPPFGHLLPAFAGRREGQGIYV